MNNSRKLSAAMLALIAAGAAAPELIGQFLDEREGNSNTAYADSGGLYTICRGLTRIDGKPVTKDMTLTQQQCDHYNGEELSQVLDWMNQNIKTPLNDVQRTGIASFCVYNLGAAKCRRSTFWKRLSDGDIPAACSEIKRWIYDGGKDCRVRKNNCYGQVSRRDQESALVCWGINEDK